MDIKDLINQAYNKDAESFEKTFDGIMAGKVEDAIGAKYDSMFGAPVQEVEAGSEDISVDEE